VDRKDDIIVIDSLFLYEQTERALLVGPGDVKDEDKVWLPRSRVFGTNLEKKYDYGYVEVPRWLVVKENLEIRWA
jgi:hypothetical protein